MKRICIVGSVDTATHLIDALPDRHEIQVVSNAEARGGNDRYTLVSRLDEIDGRIDFLIDPDGIIDSVRLNANLFGDAACVVVNSIRKTATSAASNHRHLQDAGIDFVALSYIPTLFDSSTSVEVSFAAPAANGAALANTLRELFSSRTIEIVPDTIGHVSGRIVAMVINEAAFAVMEGVASPEDIDKAMRLGVNYPEGPLRWADTIGAATIVALLDLLWAEYHDERYRVARILRDHAHSGETFLS